MNDTEPRTVKVWVCTNREHPDRACAGLVEDTKEARLEHRRWHGRQHSDREALRGSIKDRDETISELRGEVAEFRRLIKSYEDTVAGFHGEVARVETPTPPPALEINRAAYDDEDDDEVEVEPVEPESAPVEAVPAIAAVTPPVDPSPLYSPNETGSSGPNGTVF